MTYLVLAITVGLGLWFLAGVLVGLAIGYAQRRSAAVEAPAAPPRHGASTGTRQMHHVRVSVTARSMN